MTRAVVLAAGMGRRLADHSDLPKWLTPVAHTCPADQQLEALAGAGLTSVTTVVSPAASSLDAKAAAWGERLEVQLLVNEQADTLNNWYSLLTALEVPDGVEEDLVVLNSDLFAPATWFATAIADLSAASAEAALAIDPTRGRTDEAMKVRVEDGHVREIGKHPMPSTAGEYVGAAWWSAAAAEELREILRSFLSDPGRVDNWYEHAIQVHLEMGSRYEAVAVPNDGWVEIDDGEDLKAAIELTRDGAFR